MSNELTTMTAAELSARLQGGDVSAIEVTHAHLDRIGEVDGRVHAFLHVAADEALAAGARRGRAPRGRRGTRPAGRCPGRAEGRLHHHRHADHGRVEDPRPAGGRRTTRP